MGDETVLAQNSIYSQVGENLALLQDTEMNITRNVVMILLISTLKDRRLGSYILRQLGEHRANEVFLNRTVI